MRKLSLSLLSFVSSLLLLLGFSGMSLNASAATLSPMSEVSLRSYIGDTVDAFYLSMDGIYKPCHFNYVYYGDIDHVESADSSVTRWFGGNKTVTYACNDYGNDIDTSGTFAPMFYFPLNLHFNNVSHIYYGAAAYRTSNFFDMDLSSLRVYNYLVAGQFNSSVSYMSASSSGSNRPNRAYIWNGAHNYLNAFNSGVYGEFQSSSPTDFYLTDFYFSSAEFVAGSNNVVVHIFTPFVNDDYQYVGTSAPPSFSGSGSSSGTASGTISDNGDGTSDIHITVESDNTGLIGGILSGIKNLFVPTEEDLQGFSDDMDTLAQDHLGGLYEAVDILDDAFSGLSDLSARQSIHVDAVTIPLLGSDTLTLGNWDVPLKPSTTGGFALLYDGIALLADFIAAFAFLRMCRNKLDIILNPAAEVVSE